MSSNLPPGVNEGMIPGNRPEDMAWDKFHESVDDDAINLGLTPEEAKVVWNIGVAWWQLEKTLIEMRKGGPK